jgi:hypothetical protein
MSTLRCLDSLPPREAAVQAWFDFRDHLYAVGRLLGDDQRSPATIKTLEAHALHDAGKMVSGFWALRAELRSEGITI